MWIAGFIVGMATVQLMWSEPDRRTMPWVFMIGGIFATALKLSGR